MLGNSFLCHCYTIVLSMTNGAYSSYRQLKIDEILKQKKNTFLTAMHQRGRIYAYECNGFSPPLLSFASASYDLGIRLTTLLTGEKDTSHAKFVKHPYTTAVEPHVTTTQRFSGRIREVVAYKNRPTGVIFHKRSEHICILEENSLHVISSSRYSCWSMFSLQFFAYSEWCSTYGEHRDQTLLRGVAYRRMKTMENSKPVIQKHWSRSLMIVHSRKLANPDMIASEDSRGLSTAMIKRFVWK